MDPTNPTVPNSADVATSPTPDPATAAPTLPAGADAKGGGAGTGEKRPRGRPKGSGGKKRPTISPRKLQAERQDDARRGNLEKAREVQAEQRTATPPAPAKPELSEETLRSGTRMLVKLLWIFSGLGARIFGGRLVALDVEELAAGTLEAMPLVKRVPFLAKLLAVIGFPLWMAESIGRKFQGKPAAPAQLHAVAPSKAAP